MLRHNAGVATHRSMMFSYLSTKDAEQYCKEVAASLKELSGRTGWLSVSS